MNTVHIFFLIYWIIVVVILNTSISSTLYVEVPVNNIQFSPVVSLKQYLPGTKS